MLRFARNDGGNSYDSRISSSLRSPFKSFFTALDATTGDVLWASRLGSAVTNGPITYELDGLQYVVVAAGNSLATFVLNK